MPVAPTYPGVYIQEVPSGVRTIVGVSTSTAAFVGQTKRGPINKATRVLGFGDYERVFGGLDAASEMSYAVRQFFENGGSIAWIVRLAKDALPAETDLEKESGGNVLHVKALENGKAGNFIELRVDYETSNPGSTFNLKVARSIKDDRGADAQEVFSDLSMNSNDPRYVQDVVNGISKLIEVKRNAVLTEVDNGWGIATSGPFLDADGNRIDPSDLIDDMHNQIRISVNGSEPVDVVLPDQLAGANERAKLGSLCTYIRDTVVAAADGSPALASYTCEVVENDDEGDRIKMVSGAKGENSSVRVLPGASRNVSTRLRLDVTAGLICEDAVALIRPKCIPEHGYLVSGDLGSLNDLPNEDKHKFSISVDGNSPDIIDIGTYAANGSSPANKREDMARRIEEKIRGLRRSGVAYRKFTCEVVDNTKTIRLSSGSRGEGSKVVLAQADSKDIALALNLIAGMNDAAAYPAKNVLLEGGDENNNVGEDYKTYTGSEADRKGIHALDNVDLFNILCLPGISHPGILADAAAYCQSRRAFLIVDSPKNKIPSEMENLISGPELPKSEYAAIYYPWIKIRNPLTGAERSCPPSGTIAGIYARTDLTRGVWKAPAGIETNLTGVIGLDYKLTDQEQGVLNPLGVNCLRVFPVISSVNWGARTLRGADQLTSEYKYVPVRRLALFLEESLFRGLKWVVFEPNDEPLWANIRMNVRAFMHDLFLKGAFAGTKPQDAYFVRCDKETTTPNDQNLGIVNVWVGFAPLKPAEFVILNIQQIQELNKQE